MNGLCATHLKITYYTQFAAHKALQAARKRHKHTDHCECRVYRCAACDHFHLTSWTTDDARAVQASIARFA